MAEPLRLTNTYNGDGLLSRIAYPGTSNTFSYLKNGLMERQALHFHEEIDGVSGQVVFGPEPEGLFYDEAGRPVAKVALIERP